MNPSTEDFLKAFKKIDADYIYCFPNNKNIIMAAKQATFGDYVITKEDSGKIVVTKGGEVCPNSKRALREISSLVGIAVEESWTTQQMGAKLIAHLQSEDQAPAKEAVKTPAPKEEK